MEQNLSKNSQKIKKIRRNSKKNNQISIAEAKKLLPIDLKELNLKPREIKFVAAYCTNGCKGGSAVKEAGIKYKSNNIANSIAYKLLKKGNVLRAIGMFFDMVLEPFRERLEYMLLNVYYRRAFYDIAIFFNEDGSLKYLDEIPEEWRVCIDGVDTRYYGKDADRKVNSYKIADRSDAMKALYGVVYNVIGKNNEDSNKIPEKARKQLKNIWDKAYKSANIGKIIDFKNASNGGKNGR